jgi:CDP-diacylglycerol--serine O-phosphatidyltransferase
MKKLQISKKVTALLVYGRPPLVFGGLCCAIAVMWTQNPLLYTLGVVFLFTSMAFDLVDGWFAARFQPHPTLAHLADRIMDKVVYAIIFPLVAVGMMWRLVFITPDYQKTDLLHAIFILLLCIIVLIRDSFAHFIRGFTQGKGPEPENSEFTRLRTVVAAPVAALLYATAFYIPEGPPSRLYFWISWLGNLPLKGLFVIEIVFLVINFGSIARYCRKYGTTFLNELCLGNDVLRRRILSTFPNGLTIMNAMMGLLSVWFANQGRVREAYLLLIGAAIFDKLDGAMARKLGLTEPPIGDFKTSHIQLGGILDDISDGISFCVVPAWIYYLVMFRSDVPGISSLIVGWIAVIYAVMGIARLVYFTLDTTPIPGFFKGMPTPAAALMVTAPLIMFSQAVQECPGSVAFWGYASTVGMVLAAVAMNSYPVRYLHLGRFMDQTTWFRRTSIILLLVAVFSPYLGYICLLYLLLYLFSPIFTRRIQPSNALQKTDTVKID